MLFRSYSAAQIFNSLSPLFSAVEHLNLVHEVHYQSSEEHNEADRTEWHKLLSSFRKVKTLRIAKGLVEELSRSLRLDEGGLPSEFLPELQELTYSESDNNRDAFTPFINARQIAGRPITSGPFVGQVHIRTFLTVVGILLERTGKRRDREQPRCLSLFTYAGKLFIYYLHQHSSPPQTFISTAARMFSLRISRRRIFSGYIALLLLWIRI